MVGRDRELARVTGLLEDALAGRGRLVLCTGEAGIGKTRLAEELAAAATARGVAVAWARAADRGGSPPYGLWRLVLAEAATGSGSAADLWPAVFGAAELGAESSVAQRFALFAEVRGRLAQAASHGGLVLVLADLQWADEASAVLLVEVVRQLRGTRILVFATYRDGADGVLPRLSAEANTERVDLHGLPAGAGARGHGLPAQPAVGAGPGRAAGGRGGRQQFLGRRGGQDAGPIGAQPARPALGVRGGRIPGRWRPAGRPEVLARTGQFGGGGPAERGRAAAAAHRGGGRDRGPVRGAVAAAPGGGGPAPGRGVAARRPGPRGGRVRGGCFRGG